MKLLLHWYALLALFSVHRFFSVSGTRDAFIFRHTGWGPGLCPEPRWCSTWLWSVGTILFLRTTSMCISCELMVCLLVWFLYFVARSFSMHGNQAYNMSQNGQLSCSGWLHCQSGRLVSVWKVKYSEISAFVIDPFKTVSWKLNRRRTESILCTRVSASPIDPCQRPKHSNKENISWRIMIVLRTGNDEK